MADPELIAERYAVVSRLGKGGMGVVYHAKDQRLLRDVALKVLNPEKTHDDAALCFHREARAMASLKHHNIAVIYDYSGPKERPMYLAMELIAGGTLFDLVKLRGKLPEHILVAIMRDVGAALAHAHESDVVHRDIKPSNIMLEKASGRVILVDFGIAKSYTDPAMLGATLAGSDTKMRGTPEFMAPEQILGETIGPKADIFSLGTLVYMCAAGFSPFRDTSHIETMRRIVYANFAPLSKARPDISAETAEIVERSMERDPRDRPTAAELVAFSGRWLEEQEVPRQSLGKFMRGEDDGYDPEEVAWRKQQASAGATQPVAPVAPQPTGAVPTTQTMPVAPVAPRSRTGSGPVKPVADRPRATAAASAAPDDQAYIPEHLRVAPGTDLRPRRQQRAEERAQHPEQAPSSAPWLGMLLVALAIFALGWLFRDDLLVLLRIAPAPAGSTPAATAPAARPLADEALLTVTIHPWGTLTIDDHALGDVTVKEGLRLKAGRHKVQARHPEKGSEVRFVEARPGQLLHEVFDFRR